MRPIARGAAPAAVLVLALGMGGCSTVHQDRAARDERLCVKNYAQGKIAPGKADKICAARFAKKKKEAKGKDQKEDAKWGILKPIALILLIFGFAAAD